ncbi:FadR/GntR family transcriptional regulator [Bacillus sp. PK3_68]|uniref:FadR/GntR family transcriptional regulator n=1 Tax=Bacillus sp. PK3_68 TaxID=2027408 RepID=UPI000E76E2F6|nr:FadR/GntR family transcriptional regulator [Bacillus sp. PK3_68]RJS60283.1 GntR family transcriptional regulator [Bacillus sp. PK3_68]
MNIEKANRISLVDQVAAQIEELIESGAWPVGTRLPPEMELMEQFEVSRNTLREAIRALVHSGLLQTRQGSGTHVCSTSALGVAIERRVSKSDLQETLEVRHALEREAARLAAVRRSDEDVRKLRSYLDNCRQAINDGDQEGYAEADIQLHQAVAAAAHNRLLIELYEHMIDALHSSVRNLVELSFCTATHQHIHEKLVEGIATQNEEAAAEAVNEYMVYLKDLLSAGLEE